MRAERQAVVLVSCWACGALHEPPSFQAMHPFCSGCAASTSRTVDVIPFARARRARRRPRGRPELS